MKLLRYIMLILPIVMLLCFTVFSSDVPEICGKTEIRAENPVGLRVVSVLDALTAYDENTVEYGFITTRKVFLTANGLESSDFTLDSPVSFVKGVSRGEVNGKEVDRFLEKNDTEVYFSCNICGIEQYHYTDVLVVRPYIVFSDGKIGYGEPVEVSLYQTAKAICEDTTVFDSLTPEHQNVISSLVSSTEVVVNFLSGAKPHLRTLVKAGEYVTLPEAPEVSEGMCFVGWSMTNDNYYDKVVDISKISIDSHTRFYAVIVTELVEKLSRGLKQLGAIRVSGLQKDALDEIMECIGYVLQDAHDGINVDKEYVKEKYAVLVEDVKKIVNDDMNETQRSQFANIITKHVDEDVRKFLTDYFDINTKLS